MKQNSKDISKVGLFQPLKMTDLVAYQKGSVVSRTLIDKRMGTVTLFSFDKGEGLSEHTAPYDALIYIVEGEARINLAGKSSLLKVGDVLIMPANKPHSLRANEPFKMLLIMIRS
jgi:quercetin dioxygenase-like cupin family protein